MSFSLTKDLLRTAQALNRPNPQGTLVFTNGEIEVTIRPHPPGIRGKSPVAAIMDEVATAEKVAKLIEEQRAKTPEMFHPASEVAKLREFVQSLSMIDPLRRAPTPASDRCMTGDRDYRCIGCNCWKVSTMTSSRR